LLCKRENTKEDTTVRKKHPGNFDVALIKLKAFLCVILKMEMNLKSELKDYFFEHWLHRHQILGVLKL
jgi:hypothetical protein